jgi:RNA polymerase sigma-70 factor (family 1)
MLIVSQTNCRHWFKTLPVLEVKAMHEYNTLSDAELLTLLSQGNARAFEVIYNRYVGMLFGYARKTISNKPECEEILQEVFTSLWTRRATLQIQSLKYYLLNAVRYKIIRHIQHNVVKRKYARHYQLFEAAYEAAAEPGQTPDAEVVQAMLIQAIEELPTRCQMAIKLRLLENLSNSEIAQRMNITKKTVEVYMLKAFAHLRGSYHKIYKTG